MRLTKLFSGKTNIDSMPQTKQYSRVADVGRQIQSLVPGQTIRGEIVGRDGSEVQIRLSEDMILNAKIDRNINLEMGKILTFEVKNNGSALMLSPLFTNISADINVLKALDMAGLPVNDTSVSMTEQLMEAGLPVNRATLQHVYREINSFPDGEISDVINLHKLQMPVNENTMSQMASYRNLTYQLTNSMDTILKLLPQAMDEMLQEGNTSAAADTYQQLFTILQEGEAFQNSTEGIRGSMESEILSREQDILNSVNVVKPEGITGAEPGAVTGLEPEPNADVQNKVVLSSTEPMASLEVTPSEESAAPHLIQMDMAEQLLDVMNELTVSTADRQSYFTQIRNLTQGEFGAQDLLGLMEKTLQLAVESGRGLSVMREVLGQQNFQAFLQEQLSNMWTIRPSDVADPEKIEELYRRIDRQLNSLTKALESGGQTESGAYKAAVSMSQNIDFLQQLNQMYAYVQLPLHMQQGSTHGDLYVYANRKGLASADGQVSALLHLDMEHLGPTDVYVTLQNTKVNTKFYVKNDQILDFLEEHMELLTERLQKRGYDCAFSMTSKGEEERKAGDKGLAPLLEQEKGMLLSHYAFDVRT